MKKEKSAAELVVANTNCSKKEESRNRQLN
jgi:hypothetical protein